MIAISNNNINNRSKFSYSKFESKYLARKGAIWHPCEFMKTWNICHAWHGLPSHVQNMHLLMISYVSIWKKFKELWSLKALKTFHHNDVKCPYISNLRRKVTLWSPLQHFHHQYFVDSTFLPPCSNNNIYCIVVTKYLGIMTHAFFCFSLSILWVSNEWHTCVCLCGATFFLC